MEQLLGRLDFEAQSLAPRLEHRPSLRCGSWQRRLLGDLLCHQPTAQVGWRLFKLACALGSLTAALMRAALSLVLAHETHNERSERLIFVL